VAAHQPKGSPRIDPPAIHPGSPAQSPSLNSSQRISRWLCHIHRAASRHTVPTHLRNRPPIVSST
jgi:hypothetical protein